MGIFKLSNRRINQVVLLAAFMLPMVLNAQKNRTDEKGRKQGDWVKTFPGSRAILYKGQFKNDLPVGTFTYYYPSTKVKAIIKHDEETKRSVGYFYHENGELMTFGKYLNYKKDSLWFNFGPSGRISFTDSYKADSLHGVKTVYFVSENINDKSERKSRVMHYNNGKLDGDYKEWFDFGGVRTIGQYKDNKKVGYWIDYQPTGKMLAKTHYKNGIRHGWCYAYDKDGKEVNKVYYFLGELKEGKDLEFIMKQMKEKGINPNG